MILLPDLAMVRTADLFEGIMCILALFTDTTPGMPFCKCLCEVFSVTMACDSFVKLETFGASSVPKMRKQSPMPSKQPAAPKARFFPGLNLATTSLKPLASVAIPGSGRVDSACSIWAGFKPLEPAAAAIKSVLSMALLIRRGRPRVRL